MVSAGKQAVKWAHRARHESDGCCPHLSMPSSPHGGPGPCVGASGTGFNQRDTDGEPGLGHRDVAFLGLGYGWGERSVTVGHEGM